MYYDYFPYRRRRAKFYKHYRRNGYAYSDRYGPSLLESLFEAIFRLVVAIVKVLVKLIIRAINNRSHIKRDYKVIYDYPVETLESFQSKPVKINNNQSRSSVAGSIQQAQSKVYGLRNALLTPAEKNFLNVLERVVGNQYRIESQVQLSKIVEPLDSSENFINYRDFNRIKAKSIDYVLYDNNFKPYLCIELDDRSHLRLDRIKRDVFVDEVIKGVGLRILHVSATYSYNLEDLRTQILKN